MTTSPDCLTPDHGDWAAEHAAGRSGAALFRLDGRDAMIAMGADAADYLHRLLTWAIKDTPPGAGAHPYLLTPTGKVELAFGLLRVDDDAFWLDLPPGTYARAHEMLDRFLFSEDVEFEDVSARRVLLSLQGPQAPTLLASLGLPTPLAPYDNALSEGLRYSVRACAVDRSGGGGFDLWLDGPEARAHAKALWRDLIDLGATPAGGRALHSLRVEGGVPAYGAEYTLKSSPLEVSDLWGITDGKGCYPGQEAIEMTIARGRPPRALRGVRLSGPAEVGDDLTVEGKAIGQLTSVAPLPDGGVAALALVRRRKMESTDVKCGEASAELRSPGRGDM